MLIKNAVNSIREKPFKLVKVALPHDDWPLVSSELLALARYLEYEIELNDGTMNKAWIEQTQERVERLRDIARAIVLASP